MITDLISQSTSRLDQRFYLTALIPTAIFVPAIAAVIVESMGSISETLGWYSNQPVSLQLAILVGAAAVIWFLATLLTSQLWNLVRLYEGYPLDPLLRWIPELSRVLGRAYHQRRLVGLMAQAAQKDKEERAAQGEEPAAPKDPTIRKYENYPSKDFRVLPTGLGNILRSSEDYTALRYDFEIISLWPRLAAVLPADHLQDVERAEIAYQTPLVVSFWSFLLAASSVALAVSASVSADTFVAIFLGSMASSYVFYRLSFSGAKHYGNMLTSAVDLYHNDLLKRWWPELLQIKDGRRRMRALDEFVLEGTVPPSTQGVASEADATATVDDTRARGLGTSLLRTAGLIARSVGWPGATSSAVVDVPGDEPSDRSTASGSEAVPDPKLPPKPGFSVRISWLILLVTLFGARRGYQHLDASVWVLQARHDVTVFTEFTDDNVGPVAVDRGAVSSDAFAVSGSKEGLRSDDLIGRIALRRVARGATIERSDVASEDADTYSSERIVELERRRSEMSALDLRAGDDVDLVSNGRSETHPSACGSEEVTWSAPDIPARIVAILPSSDARSVSVVLALQADDLTRLCIAGADEVEILRQPA